MYKKFRFLAQGLAGDVFYPASGPTARAAGLFLYGLPAFIGQNEVTYSLVASNYVAFQPHYIGTYDSAGKYSPKSVIATCRQSQALFSAGAVAQTSKADEMFPLPPLSVAVGHSFGTLALLRGVRELKTVRSLVLLAPTVHYRRSGPDFGNRADGPAILRAIQATYPYTYRLDAMSEWNELINGLDELPAPADHPTLKEVVAIVGEKDPYLEWGPLEENLPVIVRAYCGNAVRLRLVRVPGAGHVLADLVEGRSTFSLREFCQTAVSRD